MSERERESLCLCKSIVRATAAASLRRFMASGSDKQETFGPDDIEGHQHCPAYLPRPDWPPFTRPSARAKHSSLRLDPASAVTRPDALLRKVPRSERSQPNRRAWAEPSYSRSWSVGSAACCSPRWLSSSCRNNSRRTALPLDRVTIRESFSHTGRRR